MASLPVSEIVLELSFIIFSVGKKNFHLAVLDTPTIETALNNFIWITEQNAYALRFTVTPLSFEDRAVCELANTDSVPLVIFEITFVFLAIWIDKLTDTVL